METLRGSAAALAPPHWRELITSSPRERPGGRFTRSARLGRATVTLRSPAAFLRSKQVITVANPLIHA